MPGQYSGLPRLVVSATLVDAILADINAPDLADIDENEHADAFGGWPFDDRTIDTIMHDSCSTVE